jgi:hypothetical protein
MTLYCPRCGSENIRREVTARAEFLINYVPGKAPGLEVYDGVSDLKNVKQLGLECATCGHSTDDPDADWSRTLNEVREDEAADWADAQRDERRMR